MDNQKNAEKCLIFVCEKCDFKCSKESNYKKHIETNKHKRVTESNKKMPTNEEKTFICICGNSYKYRPGLAKHKRMCSEVNKSHKSSTDVLNDDII